MWLALIILLGSPITINVESEEMCTALFEANASYWLDTEQHASMLCMQVYDI